MPSWVVRTALGGCKCFLFFVADTMAPSPSFSAARAAFAAGTAALHIPLAELSTLHQLLPRRELSREELGIVLAQLRLSNTAFGDAVFELCDLSNTGTARSVDVLTMYAALRRLVIRPSDEATAATLYLAFLSAGGVMGTLSFAQWCRFAGEIGITVGGVDCLPCEEAEATFHRRWRVAKGRLRSMLGDVLTFETFVALLAAGDAGITECMKAIGFVLMHAVVDFADAPIEKPKWPGDSESRFLSQYMTFAIDKANASASTIESPEEANDGENEEHSPGAGETEEEAENETEDEESDEEDSGDALNDLAPKASPFPDVQVADDSRRPESSMKSAGSGSRHRVSFGLTEETKTRPERPLPSPSTETTTSRKAELSIVRRTRNTSGNSPFQIDYSSLKLGERIGSGAYGDVYRGTFLMSPVAVKMFHVNVARSVGSGPGICDDQDGEDPSHMSRMVSMTALQRFASVNSQAKYKNFLREAEMMSVVRHPNLVLYMGACGDPVTPLCIVSELFTGGSLYEYLHEDKDFRPSVMTSLHFALNIARGMFYLHSSQPSILHRDLKSRNVLLSGRKGIDGDPHVVICDFGLCQLFGEDGQGSGTAPAMGTASYMAPDVVNGEKYEAADDVYSYGILLHEIFTGCVPYKGFRAMQVMFRVSAEGLRPSSDWDSAIPDVVRQLIMDCWAQERTKRPTFDKIIERLAEIEKSPP